MNNFLKSDVGRRNFLKQIIGGVAGSVATMSSMASVFPNEICSQQPIQLPEHIDNKFWELVRQYFYLKPDLLYFNTGGLGPSPRMVVDTLINKTMELEERGETGHQCVEKVNEMAANFLGADAEEIAVTRNTTEGMNIIARGLPLKKGDEVILSTHEHPGGSIPWLHLKNDIGIMIKLFESGNTQQENVEIIKKQITKKTRVISISHIPCTTGLVFPVKEISNICKNNKIFYVLDGAHPPGMIPVNLHDIGCDFYALSGHKWLLGPKGTGILYIRKEMFNHWKPTYVGAYSGTDDFENLNFEPSATAACVEYGTRNTAVILALGAAIDFMQTIGIKQIAERGKKMADYFRSELKKIPNLVKIQTPEEDLSNASIVTFKPKTMEFRDLQKTLILNHKIRTRAIHEHGLNSIRCSFHIFNNFEEVGKLVFTIKKLLAA